MIEKEEYLYEEESCLYASNFSHPKLTSALSHKLYKENGIAKAIVDMFSVEVWSRIAYVDSPEQEEMREIFSKFYLKKKISTVFLALEILSKIGEFSVAYFGLKNDNPEDPINGKYSLEDIDYIRVFSDQELEIDEYEEEMNRNYGKPKMYKLNNKEKTRIHASRCLHVSRTIIGSFVKSEFYLDQAYKRMIDADRVVGGCANIYYLNGRGGLFINYKEGHEPRTEKDAQEKMGVAKRLLKKFLRGVTRVAFTEGLEVKSIEHKVHSPKDTFETIIKYISLTYRIPWRILMGTEQGSEAGTTDKEAFKNSVIKYRDSISELILRDFIDKLIEFGVGFSDDYTVSWENYEISATEDAEVKDKKIDMMVKFANIPEEHRAVDMKTFQRDYLGIKSDTISEETMSKLDKRIKERQTEKAVDNDASNKN